MALNLDSLKNLSTPTDTPEKAHTPWIAHSSVEATHQSSAPEATIMSPSVPLVEKTSSMRPRISLMKLKQASSGDASDVVVEPVVAESAISDNLSVAELEKWFTSHVKIEEIVSIEQETEETKVLAVPEISTISAPVEAVASTPKEDSLWSESIVIDGGEEDVSAAEEIVAEPKEVFPNFRISNTLGLDDDLIDFQDVISSDTLEVPKEIWAMQWTEIETEVPALIPEENIVKHEEAMVQDAVLEEAPSTETVVTEAVSVTPEYVAEVKTELSEGRRAGFRFLVQKKTKIIAGVTVVFSLWLIAIIWTSLFSTDVHKTGKSNIQEIHNAVPVTETSTGSQAVPAEIEAASYEMGRDYSVTKNTKKNVRSKAVDTTLSGSGTPTP